MKTFLGYIGLFFMHIFCIPIFFVMVIVGIVKAAIDWKEFGWRI